MVKKKHVVVHTTYHSMDISYKCSHVGINIHQQPTHIHSEHIHIGRKKNSAMDQLDMGIHVTDPWVLLAMRIANL